ncbi:hypothetical protein [Faucicola atlantae]|nr:hypothetical protein [Moraxella atlantae]
MLILNNPMGKIGLPVVMTLLCVFFSYLASHPLQLFAVHLFSV